MTSAHCAPVIHLLTPHKTCSRDSCARDILAGPHTLQICCGRSHAMFQPLLIGASNRKATEARPGLARPGTRHSETWMEKVLFDHQCWSIHPSCVWFILLKVLEYIYFIWYYNLFILNFFFVGTWLLLHLLAGFLFLPPARNSLQWTWNGSFLLFFFRSHKCSNFCSSPQTEAIYLFKFLGQLHLIASHVCFEVFVVR